MVPVGLHSAAGTASDLKDAIRKFKRALECNANHPETLHQWGLILMKSEGQISLEQARIKLWEARKSLFAAKGNKNKLASSILTDLASVLAEQEEYVAAAYCLKEAVLYNTKNTKAFWKLGEVLLEEEEFEESCSSFESAYQLDPRSFPAEGLADWGKALFERSQQESDAQKKALLQDQTQKKCEEALKACSPDERNTTALHYLGEVLVEKKRFKEAIKVLEEAIDLEEECSEKAWTVCLWSRASSELKRYSEAVQKLEALYTELEDDEESNEENKAHILHTLGTILKKQGKESAASKKFKEAEELYISCGKSDWADECANLASASPSSGLSPSSSARRSRAALHYERSYSRFGLNKALWDAFKSFEQPIQLSSAQKLWNMAMTDGKLDPSERRVFEYILSAETPVQVESEANDFLEEKLGTRRTKKHQTNQKKTKRRDRSRTPRRRR